MKLLLADFIPYEHTNYYAFECESIEEAKNVLKDGVNSNKDTFMFFGHSLYRTDCRHAEIISLEDFWLYRTAQRRTGNYAHTETTF